MDFRFFYGSGYLAFTDGVSTRHLLMVADCGNATVHVIDVVNGTHVGYVAAPGTITCFRGLATRKSLAAVSCLDSHARIVVRVFEASGESTWTALRTIAVAGSRLRFTADGLRLVVAEHILHKTWILAPPHFSAGGELLWGY